MKSKIYKIISILKYMEKKEDIVIPYYSRYSRKLYDTKNSLHTFSFFKLHSKLPCSVILKILVLIYLLFLN
jgi:hypothetical protein